MKNDELAFPYSGVHKGKDKTYLVDSHGMTLRDYFAAKALQGWLASFGENDKHPAFSGYADDTARLSYAMADAMLKAREGE